MRLILSLPLFVWTLLFIAGFFSVILALPGVCQPMADKPWFSCGIAFTLAIIVMVTSWILFWVTGQYYQRKYWARYC